MSVVIKVENLSKHYRLGVIGSGTLHEDLNRWWAMRRGKPDPLLKIGQTDYGNRNYLNTLSEAYFRAGDNNKAIEFKEKALALVSRQLRDRDYCEKLRGSDTREALYALLTQAEESHAA